MAARVSAGQVSQQQAKITHKITQLNAMQPGSDATLLANLKTVLDRLDTEGLNTATTWFSQKYTPAYHAADLELAKLAKDLTDLSAFRNPESIFTDKNGAPLPPNLVQQTKTLIGQKFKEAEDRDRARVEDAKARMDADLTNEQIAFSVNAPKGAIDRLERFDSFDMFENMEKVPKRRMNGCPSDW